MGEGPYHTATAQLVIQLEDVNNTPPVLRLVSTDLRNRNFNWLIADGFDPALYKYLYGLHVVPGLAVCVCVFYIFINSTTIQELYIEWINVFHAKSFGSIVNISTV